MVNVCKIVIKFQIIHFSKLTTTNNGTNNVIMLYINWRGKKPKRKILCKEKHGVIFYFFIHPAKCVNVC